MTKKQRGKLAVDALKKEYPDAICTLDYEEPYQLLFATRLAAQCTDLRVNKVTTVLYKEYPTLQSLANASVEDVEKIVRPCGLGNTKSRDLVAGANVLIRDYGGVVPDNMEDLLKIPGVGRKTASVVLGDIFGQPVIVTDTHCIRITNLLGLTDSKTPAVVEKELKKIIEPKESNDFCHRLVLHGREVCIARRPKCDICTMFEFCKNSPYLKMD